VRRYDHHCFWVGTCVGQRNHGRFWQYLTSQLVLILWVASINSSAYVHQPTANGWVEANLLPLCMSFVLYCFALFVFSLWGLHTYLIITNQTTWEVTKSHNISYLNKVPGNVAPFNRGVKRNLREYCLGEVLEPYVLPTGEKLTVLGAQETFWNNKSYSCC
jgi:palmitoyltransferase